jgi:hypothetical protein
MRRALRSIDRFLWSQDVELEVWRDAICGALCAAALAWAAIGCFR